MAITLVGQSGSTVSGTTTLTPAVPAGTSDVSNDAAFLCLVNKLSSVTPTTPTNWSLVGTATVGTGSDGVGTGLVRITVFFIAVPSGFTAPTVAITSGNVVIGTMITVRPQARFRIVAANLNQSSGSDTTSGTAFVATTATDVGLDGGDYCIIISGFTTNTTVSAIGGTISFGGATVGAINTRTLGSATGNAVGFSANYVTVTGGPSSAVEHADFTLAGASTGGSMYVRVREELNPDAFLPAGTAWMTAIPRASLW